MNRLYNSLSKQFEANPIAFRAKIVALYNKYKYPISMTPYGINIMGMRSTDANSATFNDVCIFFNQQDMYVCKFTTDPSQVNLRTPVNAKGCAILKEGFYYNIWAIGNHKQKKDHQALIQVNPVYVYRDNNKDDNLDFNGTVESGLFGINCHRASLLKVNELIGAWSAGCQVFSDYKDLAKLIFLCKMDLNNRTSNNKYFNYALFKEL